MASGVDVSTTVELLLVPNLLAVMALVCPAVLMAVVVVVLFGVVVARPDWLVARSSRPTAVRSLW